MVLGQALKAASEMRIGTQMISEGNAATGDLEDDGEAGQGRGRSSVRV